MNVKMCKILVWKVFINFIDIINMVMSFDVDICYHGNCNLIV